MAIERTERVIELGSTIPRLRTEVERLEHDLAEAKGRLTASKSELDKLLSGQGQPSPAAVAGSAQARQPPTPAAANGYARQMPTTSTRSGSVADKIVHIVTSNPQKEFSVPDLARAAGGKPRSVKSTLVRLARLGVLDRVGWGVYRAGKMLKKEEANVAKH